LKARAGIGAQAGLRPTRRKCKLDMLEASTTSRRPGHHLHQRWTASRRCRLDIVDASSSRLRPGHRLHQTINRELSM